MEEKGGFQGGDNGEHDVMQQAEAHGSCPGFFISRYGARFSSSTELTVPLSQLYQKYPS